MASGRSAHFPFCKGEMGAYFLFQPAESPVRLFMVHIRNIDSVSEHQLQPFQLTAVLLYCLYCRLGRNQLHTGLYIEERITCYPCEGGKKNKYRRQFFAR